MQPSGTRSVTATLVLGVPPLNISVTCFSIQLIDGWASFNMALTSSPWYARLDGLPMS